MARRRQFLATTALALSTLAGCQGQQDQPTTDTVTTTTTATTETATTAETTTAEPPSGMEMGVDVTVTQAPGNAFYWVVPGERRLSKAVFGTQDHPRGEVSHLIQRAQTLPGPLSETVPQVLRDLPILAGLPVEARTPASDGPGFEATKIKTPFGDEGRVTEGELSVTYKDRRPFDLPGGLTDTPDDVDLTARFTDPAGHEYQLQVGNVFQPPIPGYETGGGVMTDAWHHGVTGTGSPLMPKVFTYGAFWGVGNVVIDGDVADRRKVIHFMTSQAVRQSDYGLALDEDLPLRAEETIGGQVHHTHGIVLPIRITDRGPVYEPVQTAFELPDGNTQPFIHAMWEQDTIERSVFRNWTPGRPGMDGGSRTVRVEQEPGNTVYWVPPGPRRISEAVFGTPDAPRGLVEPRIEQARQLPGPLAETVPQLLQDLPILVGLPEQARQTTSDGSAYTKTSIPTPFPDDGMVTSGELDLAYTDVRPYDWPGPLTDTPDSVSLQTRFTDPAGNDYQLRVGTVFQPPIPGYETGGGVMTGAWHHGTTGTGSPLMPRVFAHGAFWGVGNVVINGEVTDERKVIHFMTTQNVRDREYRLAVDEDLPLAPSETIGNQAHHTHGIVLPVTVTDQGPVYEPVTTAFTLPNGNTQPFIHIMFEQDTIVEGPWKEYSPEIDGGSDGMTSTPTTEGEIQTVTIEATEYAFDPGRVTTEVGVPLEITLKNTGSIAHNLAIGAFDVQTETIQGGQSTTVEFTPDQTGEFEYWCDVSGHRDAGMEGVLVVEG